jgi:hypothetical protein
MTLQEFLQRAVEVVNHAGALSIVR